MEKKDNKTNKEKISFNIINCPLCESKKYNSKYKIKKYNIVECSSCKHIYLNPRPGDEVLYGLYDAAYFIGHGFDKTVNYLQTKEKPSNEEIKEAQWLINEIKKYRKNGTLLDVGCSYGFFLGVAKQTGFDVAGTDISPAVKEYVKEKLKVPISIGVLEKVEIEKEKYDIITMTEVVEHLPYPKKTLAHIKELLRQGGIIVIQTGNINSIKARWYGKRWDYFTLPGHINYFSIPSLTKTLIELGFSILKIIPPHDFEDSRLSKKITHFGLNKENSGVKKRIFLIIKRCAQFYDSLLSPGMIIIARK